MKTKKKSTPASRSRMFPLSLRTKLLLMLFKKQRLHKKFFVSMNHSRFLVKNVTAALNRALIHIFRAKIAKTGSRCAGIARETRTQRSKSRQPRVESQTKLQRIFRLKQLHIEISVDKLRLAAHRPENSQNLECLFALRSYRSSSSSRLFLRPATWRLPSLRLVAMIQMPRNAIGPRLKRLVHARKIFSRSKNAFKPYVNGKISTKLCFPFPFAAFFHRAAKNIHFRSF